MKKEEIEELRQTVDENHWTEGDYYDMRRDVRRLLAEREALLEALADAEDKCRGLASSAAQRHCDMDALACRLVEEADLIDSALTLAES